MEDELGPLTASNVKIMVLTWAHILAAYSIWVMMEYLTDVWELNFTSAAAIVNIFMGVASVMPIGIAFLVDTLFGNFWMLFLSSSAYTIGLGFLSMSTPPVLSKSTGTCSSYEQECIGTVQKALFYTSLPLLAIGIAGHFVSLSSFVEEQTSDAKGKEKKEGHRAYKIVGSIVLVIVLIASAFALPYIKPWSVRFGIPAICTLVTTIVFASGSGSYNREKPKGSPYTRMFRVFVASTLKMHLHHPTDDSKIYGRTGQGKKSRPYPSRFRCLEKASIISPSHILEEQEKQRWKLCKATDVDETKIALRLIPMSMTFVVVGLVTSIGNTYFLEQANHMNPKVGKLKFPLPVLLMFYDMAKSQAKGFYNRMEKCCSESLRKYAPAVGVGVGMLLSILCCITAAKVEERRIGVIEKHGLLDKPDEKTPMSMFWLLPQFLLLGALDGLAHRSVTCFFRDQVPSSWNIPSSDEVIGSKDIDTDQSEKDEGHASLRSHMMIFTGGVFGAGTIGGALSVFIVGRISKRGGRPGWFRPTLNKSRLDNYYWTLAVLSSIVLVLYALIAIWYKYGESAADQEEQPEDENETNCAELCCCC